MRVADEIIENVASEFVDVMNRRREATQPIVERDAQSYKDMIDLLGAITREIASTCRETVSLTYRPVGINVEKRTSYTTFSLRQGDVNYASFDSIDFEIVIAEDSMTVNGKRYGSEDHRQAYSDMVSHTVSKMSLNVVRADFGLPCDPIRQMSRRQGG